MKNQITSRDYELLSAYLDNQLGTQECARLEARLNLEPALQKEYHELTKTRLLLRELPRLRAPHNYFINADSVAKSTKFRTSLRLAPAYGIASPIATILLVLTVFGNRLLSSTAPVALAPAPEASIEMMEVVQEVELSVAPTVEAMEAAPKLMVEAPANDTPPPPSAELAMGESGLPTPTTIYLDAIPPSSTPDGLSLAMIEPTATATISCEQYYLSGDNQNLALSAICSTPTESPSIFVEGIQATPTTVSTLNGTPVSDLFATAPLTPSLTPSPLPMPTETPAIGLEAAPETRIEAPLIPADSSIMMDADQPTPTQPELTVEPQKTLNYDFLQYVLLAIELSLAAIAILAGLMAIILRIRAGR
jgi:hypothetical protein